MLSPFMGILLALTMSAFAQDNLPPDVRADTPSRLPPVTRVGD